MSTLKVSSLQHPSSAVENFKLASDGTVEVYDGSTWVSVGLPLGAATPTDGQYLAYATATGTWDPVDAPQGLRIESGTRSWTVYGSGTEVYAVTFGTAFSSAPTIWENHDNEVYDVTFTGVTASGFTINAPWNSGSPTGAFVRWYALGV